MNLKPKTYNPIRPDGGFTLIEALVTAALFSMMITVISGVFISALNLQRRAFNLQQVEENTNFLLESMAKEIRVSAIDDPDTNCPTLPATILNITHPVNGSIRYSLSGASVTRRANGVDTIVSANTVEFTRLQFCVSGNGATDQRQPRVTLIASIKSANTKEQAIIDFQTTLSARFLQEP